MIEASVTGEGRRSSSPRARRRTALAALSALVTGLVVPVALAPSASATTFSNVAPIVVADAGAAPGVATPYPSTISVSGTSGTISSLSVTLNGLNHASPDHLDVLLVSPGGQRLVLLSDAGSLAATDTTITLSDTAAGAAPATGALLTGSYRPTNHGTGDSFPAPAPASPSNPAPAGTATLANTFNGVGANGNWSLYVVDDTADLTGSLTGGWSIEITTAVTAAATTTTMTSSLNPSTTGTAVTFTATVTSAGNPVTTGAVTFSDGATTLASNVSLNASGQASVTTSALTEGVRAITATFSGALGFGSGSGNLTQIVDTATTATGSTFCNNGGLAIRDAATASVYPSRISVSGTSGTVSGLAVTLTGLTHSTPDDIDVLLVGPTGQSMVVLSDAGGAAPVTDVDVTLTDSAASSVPSDAAPTSTSYRPTDNGTPEGFASPAPSGPYSRPAPTGSSTLDGVFGSSSPNGTWSLYVVDDTAGATGSVGGWCLTFVPPAQPTVTIITSSANPSLLGQQVTLTAHVSTGAGTPVAEGSVTFRDGATIVAADVPVNAAGQAAWETSTLAEGARAISATYSPATGFRSSSGSFTQLVDAATTATGTTFCNNNGLTIRDATSASVYPSRVFVTGQSMLAGLTVTVKGLTHSAPGDIDLLLRGPDGGSIVLLSDAGGSAAVDGITVVLADGAAGLPSESALTSGTFRPANYGTGDGFPAPAPAGGAQSPAPAGAATLAGVFGAGSPDGTWSLYVVDDSAGGSGSLSGWCLQTAPSTPVVSVPADIAVDTTDAGGAVVTYSATASDATGAITPTCSHPSGTVFPLGMTTVLCEATNDAGTSQESFTVSVTGWRMSTTPSTSTVDTGTAQTVTFTLERNDGSGWVPDGAGLEPTIVLSGFGSILGAGSTCTAAATPCGVTVSSVLEGVTEVTASVLLGALEVSGTASITFVAPDATPPVITPLVDGTLGGDGWYRSDTTVSWSVSDPESPITATTGCDPVTISADTAGTAFVCSATSRGGSAAAHLTVKVDKTAPVLSPSITSGDTVTVGSTLTPGASDALSGLASATCIPATVTVIGQNLPFSCTASDVAGNTSSIMGTFTASLGFSAFASPLPRSVLTRSASSIPVKFGLVDARGAVTGAAAQALVAGSQLRVVLTGPGATGRVTVSSAECTFSSATGLFQCNVKTPKLSSSQVGPSNPYTLVVQQRRPGSTRSSDFFAVPGAIETIFFK